MKLVRVNSFLALLMALSLPAAVVQAQEKVLIYRCTDAHGAVTLQNDKPCPKGSKQEKRVLEVATSASPPAALAREATRVEPAAASTLSAPVATPQPAAITPPSPTVGPGPAPEPGSLPDAELASDTGTTDEDRLPPPLLYECRTYNDDHYLSENGTPQQRCVVLTTTGLGGLEAGGAGQACEMKTDECQRVPDGALCDRWRQRLRETESALRFGTQDDRPFAEAEVARIGRIVRESVCGQ